MARTIWGVTELAFDDSDGYGIAFNFPTVGPLTVADELRLSALDESVTVPIAKLLRSQTKHLRDELDEANKRADEYEYLYNDARESLHEARDELQKLPDVVEVLEAYELGYRDAELGLPRRDLAAKGQERIP